jgi:hypothetical protein
VKRKEVQNGGVAYSAEEQRISEKHPGSEGAQVPSTADTERKTEKIEDNTENDDIRD